MRLTVLILFSCLILACQPKSQLTKNSSTVYAETTLAPITDSLWTKVVKKSNTQWEQELSPSQYQVLRQKGTERAFTSPLLKEKRKGMFHCAACGNPLFSSATKYKSGTGWPSFWEPYHRKAVKNVRDNSYGMQRTEVVCARCDGHLGHVFDDGPEPTGLRYCMNGDAMGFTPEQKLTKAYFAQGCFWCLEEIFEAVKGVDEVVSGFSGGKSENTTYKDVSRGLTQHAEAVEVIYDANVISFEELLKVYFNSGDITQVNGQGPDRGAQYRSVAFYTNEMEKKQINDFINKLNPKYDNSIAVEVMPFKKFIAAEEYHQDFVKRNPNQGYVRSVSVPRFKKAIKNFPELLKTEFKK